jgi:hypothetical protein
MTGIVQINSTFMLPVNYLLFTTTEPEGYRPQFGTADFPVLQYWPGDVTFNGALPDVDDIVYLINYIYKNGPPPLHPITGDVNGPDRFVDVEDIVYLITYLFKFGPEPLPGDPW